MQCYFEKCYNLKSNVPIYCEESIAKGKLINSKPVRDADLQIGIQVCDFRPGTSYYEMI